MIGVLGFLVTVAASQSPTSVWPTLEHAAAGEAVAVFEIRDVSKSIQNLERSAFGLWVEQLVGEDVGVIRKSNMRLMAAWYGTLSGGQPDVLLVGDVQRQVDGIQKLMASWWQTFGLKSVPAVERDGWNLVTLADRKTSITVGAHRKPGRVAWSTVESRVLSMGKAHPAALSDDETFRGMVNFAPLADIRGSVHVPRLFGWILEQPRGAILARLIGRLGLAGVQMGTFSASLASRREVRLRAKTRVIGAFDGVLSAIGPAIDIQWPKNIPADVEDFTAVSVVPARVLETVYRGLAADNPLQFALLQAQLSALEQQLGKQIVSGIAGETPRTWVSYQDSRGGRVAILGVEDPGGVRELISALGTAYPSVAFEPFVMGDAPAVRLGRARGSPVLSFGADSVVFAESEDALSRHLKLSTAQGAAAGLLDGQAVVFGLSRGLIGKAATQMGVIRKTADSGDVTAFGLEREGPEFLFSARIRR